MTTENGAFFLHTFGTETTPLIAAPGCLQKRNPEGGEREDGLFHPTDPPTTPSTSFSKNACSIPIPSVGRERGVRCASSRFHILCIVHGWCLSTMYTYRVCVQCSCTAVGAKSFLKLLDPRLRSLCLLTATPSPLLSAARLPRFGIPAVKRRCATVGRLLRSYAL